MPKLTPFTSEFGNVLIYALIYTILIHRMRNGYYSTEQAKRVKSISNLMVVYPLVYVVCTIPLASSRMASMSGNPPSLARLCLCGAMITSNGWLDVLLYTCTRRIMIFSDEPPADNNGIDTFAVFWTEKPKRFGGECVIEANARARRTRSRVTLPSRNDSSDDLCGMSSRDIKLVTTTQVTNEPAQPEDYEEMEAEARKARPVTPVGRWSEETSGSRSLSLKELDFAHLPQ